MSVEIVTLAGLDMNPPCCQHGSQSRGTQEQSSPGRAEASQLVCTLIPERRLRQVLRSSASLTNRVAADSDQMVLRDVELMLHVLCPHTDEPRLAGVLAD